MDTPVHSAVIFAMERELAPFLRRCRRVDGGGIPCFERDGTVYACGGIGRAAAARSAAAVLERYRPGRVISAGFAGALEPNLQVGQILNPDVVVDAQTGRQYHTQPAGGQRDQVTLVTATHPAGHADKRQLATRFGAHLVDMEAAAVAEATVRAGVEFMVIKVVSDEMDFAMPPVDLFVTSAGEFQEAKFAVWAAWHPRLWAGVWRLSRNSRAAARTLSNHLERTAREWQRYPLAAASSATR